MKKDNRPLGIFDSGLGGLTVAAAIRKKMPGEDIIYLGDNARVPYGDKSPEIIAKFAVEDASFLVKRGVKIIVAACNTVSAIALDAVKKRFPEMPLIGVLEAGVNACLAENPSDMAIIGTRATISSDAYRRLIHFKNPSINVRSIATPLFVPVIEEGLQHEPLFDEVIRFYLNPLIDNPPDILLLACTHYPLIKDNLKKYLPDSVKIIDSAETCADFTASHMRELGIVAGDSRNGTEKYFVTDMPSNFYLQAQRFLGRNLDNFEKINQVLSSQK
jgi:glutamate racemase